MTLALIDYSLFQVVMKSKWNRDSKKSKEESDEESKEESNERKDLTVYSFKIMKRSLVKKSGTKLAESISVAN